MREALLSESPKHALKLEYQFEGRAITVLWERLWSKAALKTTFDSEGGILDQRIIRLDKSLEETVGSFIESETLLVKKTDYKKVKLNKNCPSCGSQSLVRYAEHVSNPEEIPTVPKYLCADCNSESYYLTDSYLNRLVDEHPHLFSEGELSNRNRNSEAFIRELKEYIIKIFAAKKVLTIK